MVNFHSLQHEIQNNLFMGELNCQKLLAVMVTSKKYIVTTFSWFPYGWFSITCFPCALFLKNNTIYFISCIWWSSSLYSEIHQKYLKLKRKYMFYSISYTSGAMEIIGLHKNMNYGFLDNELFSFKRSFANINEISPILDLIW